MTFPGTIQLLRIPFSLFLAPVFLLALAEAHEIRIADAVLAFAVLHLLVYPASNGYNSYVDCDDTPIGGLEKPPPPTRALFFTTLAMDAVAVLISLFISVPFAGCVLVYILASRAYSGPPLRLKRFAVGGFATVVVFQGAFCFYFSWLAVSGKPMEIFSSAGWLMLASAAQIAGAYPLTQVYQHEADRRAGIFSLSRKLGIYGTFYFAGTMFAVADVCYLMYFGAVGDLMSFLQLQLFLLPMLSYYMWWLVKVRRDRAAANFRNTMRMNLVASICMASCFILFIIQNHFL